MTALKLRSEAAKVLLQLTREQFSFWEEQLRGYATATFPASHAMHYWYIMSTIALEGDDDFRIKKKDAENALPRHKLETGRKYLAECETLGFTSTVTTAGKRYTELTKAGQLVVSNALGRWITEFAKVRRAIDGPQTVGKDSDLEDVETG